MTELVTTGTWIVKPGEEEAFVQDWTSFVEWASTQPGATTFRLGRDAVDSSKFISFAAWADDAAAHAWKSQPEFTELLGRARAHTTYFEAHELEVASKVSAAATAKAM
jgi:heme-degrading monooxygenase HmoA